MQVKLGMPVWLKDIDGPDMIIHGIINPGYWSCKWWDGKKFCFETIHENALTDKKPEKPVTAFGGNRKIRNSYD